MESVLARMGSHALVEQNHPLPPHLNNPLMRTIKFRFFDGEKMCPVGELSFFADNAGYHINGEFPSTGKDPYPLMQFTGLRDKNGIEIYEGDVILLEDSVRIPITDEGAGPDEPENHLSPVVFKYGCFGLDVLESGDCYGKAFWSFSALEADYVKANELEIIGNIYENPELLTKTST